MSNVFSDRRALPEVALLAGLALVASVGFAAVLGGCGSSYEAPLPPRDQLHYPIGLAMHPDGRFLYVVNSNFNARYREDSGGTVAVVDTHGMQIRADGTPYIPSFGGSIEVNDDGTRAYVAVRHDDQLAVLNVAKQQASAAAGASVFCRDREGEATSNPEDCSLDRVPRDSGKPFATDPFGLSVTTLRRDIPDDGSEREVPVDVVGMSYLASNRVSAVSLPNRSIANADAETASLGSGGNALVRRPGTLSHYVAGRNTDHVSRFAPFLNFRQEGSFGDIEGLFGQGTVTVSHYSDQGGDIAIDARGIAFDDDGDRLFVASREPDALYIFDLVAADPETGSGLRHELAATVPLSNDPSDLVLHERPDGRLRVYVPSYDDEVIDVVDPKTNRVIDAIELPASPYDMVVDKASYRCDGQGSPCRAYVTLFGDAAPGSDECGPRARQCGSLGVVDLDPTSTRYHRLVKKIR